MVVIAGCGDVTFVGEDFGGSVEISPVTDQPGCFTLTGDDQHWATLSLKELAKGDQILELVATSDGHFEQWHRVGTHAGTPKVVPRKSFSGLVRRWTKQGQDGCNVPPADSSVA